MGLEAAGEIESVGADVAGFRVGDRVALIPSYGATQYGFYGETSIAPSRSLVRIPDGVGFVEAAATWVAFGTAWAGLVSIGTILKEQTVLINAASSSVGLAAIQIANRIGAHPIALTRTSEKLGALRMHGATHVIATAEQDLVKEVKALTDGKGADLVFDAVGGAGFADLCQATKTGGLLILYGALDKRVTAVPPFEVFGRNLTIRGFAMPTLAKDETTFGELKSFVQKGMHEGYLRPVIARTFDFDDIADAHRFLESGNQVGKIVVTL
jgi:NADPH:quinone reductase-like Zn-dependent oxidoreductase